MSEESYRLNVNRKVTGPWSQNCLMASFDRISPVTGILTETYQRYERLRTQWVNEGLDNGNATPDHIARELKEVKTEFRSQLGVPTDRNVVEARVDTSDELRSTLANLAIGGYRTAVYLDVQGLHAVGVVPVDHSTYEIRSTWSPFPIGEPIEVDDIFECLDRAPRRRTRGSHSQRTSPADNVIALPSEPTGSKPPYPDL